MIKIECIHLQDENLCSHIRIAHSTKEGMRCLLCIFPNATCLHKKKFIDSPCIGVCSTSIGDDVCKGCLRTHKEVSEWNSYLDDKKIEINERIHKSN